MLGELTRSRVKRLVRQELAALLRRDGVKARSLLTRRRRTTGSADDLIAALERAVPALMRWRWLRFGTTEQSAQAGGWVQSVTLFDEAAQPTSCMFLVRPEPEGTLRIDACVVGSAHPVLAS